MADQIGRMLAEADDHEHATVQALAIRAGLRWRCACGWINPTSDTSVSPCDGCGRDRDELRGDE